MSRVYKGSKFELELYIPNASNDIEKLSISLYTDNPIISADFIEGFELEGNILKMVVPAAALCNMKDGVINYSVQGFINGDFFNYDRQSNYFLKSPSTISNDTTCPEGEEITINQNGTYEGLFDKVIVEVDGGSGDCNVGPLEVIWEASWNFNNFYAFNDNLDGYDYVHIDASQALVDKYNEGEKSVKDNLQTLSITENGTYTPPTYETLYITNGVKFPIPTPTKSIKIVYTPLSSYYILGTTSNWWWDNEPQTYGIFQWDNGIKIAWGNYFQENDLHAPLYQENTIELFIETGKVILNGETHYMNTREGDFNTDSQCFLGGDFETSNFNIRQLVIDDKEIFFTPDNQILIDNERVDNLGNTYANYSIKNDFEGYKRVDVNVLSDYVDDPALGFIVPMIGVSENLASDIDDKVNEGIITTYGLFGSNVDFYDSDLVDIPFIILSTPNLDGITKLENVLGDFTYNEYKIAFIDEMDCTYIETVSDAFINCDFRINKLTNLGQSFTSEQEVLLPTFDYGKWYNEDQIMKSLVESLYDFSAGANKYGVTTSTLKVPRTWAAVDEAIAKGWTITYQ